MALGCKDREIYRKSEIVAKSQFLYASMIYSCITRFFKTNPEKCYGLAEYYQKCYGLAEYNALCMETLLHGQP